MDNWLLFLIIGIGIVTSFLNKKTKTISQGPVSKPKETETPSTGYYPDRREETRGNVQSKRSEEARWSEQPKREESGPAQNFEGSREAKKERANKLDTYLDESIKDNFPAYKPEANQVAQGIIWSEILGPPRSKRPHSLRQR